MTPEKCSSYHFGLWAVEPEWFNSAVEAVRSGLWKPNGETVAMDGEMDDSAPAYRVVDGVAVVSIAGPMMKARSKFGGTSTVDTRTQIRKAVNDDSVSSILLHIDSPGGTVAGTEALAQDVASANRRKPVYAHIEDLGASAAYYVASQASHITASKGSQVGSLGVYGVLTDSSKMAEMRGLKVHLISSGGVKGAGTPGTEITDEQIASYQRNVDDATKHFKNAVGSGRGDKIESVDALFDGRVHDAAQAKKLGLIDEVASLDAAMTAITQETSRMNAEAFTKYAAENSEAAEVKALIAQGFKAGEASAHQAELNRMSAIADACKDHPALAISSFLLGHDAEQAKFAVDVANKTTADKQATIDAQAEEIERLKAELGTQGAVGTAGSAAKRDDEVPADADPKTVAKSEWDKMSAEDRKSWANEDVFVRARARAIARELASAN